MSKKNDLVSMGKQLAFLLRHDQEALGKGLIDRHGWRSVDELCKNHGYTKEMIEEIVKTNEKKRYEFNDEYNHSKIRARQGHSINVDVELTEVEVVPEYLFHGTSSKWVDKIMSEGLKKMSRQHVHLSNSYATAVENGKRHVHGDDKIAVILVHTSAMMEDGIKIYKSNNNVYLVDYVDPKYIAEVSYDGCFSTPLCGSGG